MTYKLLALDVDGTLLRRDGTVHPDDHAAIGRVIASGVAVTIVTGRLYSGTHAVARSVGLSGPIACVDGSHIVDLRDDGALFHASIAGDDAALLREVLERHGATTFLFAHDTIVHDPGGEPYAGYVSTWSPHLDVVASVHEHPYWEHERGLMAVVAVAPERDIRAAADELAERLGHAAHVIFFPVHRVDLFAMVIRAAGTTKGTAVEWLARHHGCTPAEVVVVGDWINDVPMFQVAGRSFVMRQAPPAVKAAATDELDADCWNGGGVAEAVRRAFGIWQRRPPGARGRAGALRDAGRDASGRRTRLGTPGAHRDGEARSGTTGSRASPGEVDRRLYRLAFVPGEVDRRLYRLAFVPGEVDRRLYRLAFVLYGLESDPGEVARVLYRLESDPGEVARVLYGLAPQPGKSLRPLYRLEFVPGKVARVLYRLEFVPGKVARVLYRLAFDLAGVAHVLYRLRAAPLRARARATAGRVSPLQARIRPRQGRARPLRARVRPRQVARRSRSPPLDRPLHGLPRPHGHAGALLRSGSRSGRGTAVATSPARMSAGVRAGFASSIWAATDAMMGEANEVPSTCW